MKIALLESDYAEISRMISVAKAEINQVVGKTVYVMEGDDGALNALLGAISKSKAMEESDD